MKTQIVISWAMSSPHERWNSGCFTPHKSIYGNMSIVTGRHPNALAFNLL
jgi:hypothetical protein